MVINFHLKIKYLACCFAFQSEFELQNRTTPKVFLLCFGNVTSQPQPRLTTEDYFVFEIKVIVRVSQTLCLDLIVCSACQLQTSHCTLSSVMFVSVELHSVQ